MATSSRQRNREPQEHGRTTASSQPRAESCTNVPVPIADPLLSFITTQAKFRALSLVRLGLFPWDDVEDLSQDILLDLLQRFSKYKSSRGRLYSFARLVMINRTKALIERQSRRNRCMVQIDTKNWEGQPSLWSQQFDLALGSDRKIDVHRAIGRLPVPVREVANDLLKSLTVPEICGRRGKSRSRIYQMMAQIRISFTQSGLAPCVSIKSTLRGAPKKK